MNAKQEKDNSARPSFVPYTINVEDCKTLETFEQVLTRIFANPSDTAQNTNTTEVNELFLTHLAHGLQGSEQYNPEQTPGMVMAYVRELAEQHPRQKDACEFFLGYFKQITALHGSKIAQDSMPNNLERIPPGNSKHPLPFCPTNINDKKIKTQRLIEAMCHDLKLLHLTNLMRLYSDYVELGKPVPEDNFASSRFNQLFKLMMTNLVSSKSDQKSLKKKIKLYLAVAHRLLQDKSIIDFEGAGIINLVLQLHVDFLEDKYYLKQDIKALSNLFQENKNYKVLRENMKPASCIPFYAITSKDLKFINENIFWDKIFLSGQQYHALSVRIPALREEARTQGIFQPIFQTNLLTILDGCSLYWSAKNYKKTDLDSLPTLTCKSWILTREKLIYWDKHNDIYTEQNIKDDDLAELAMKLKVQHQLTNSARLLSSKEMKLIVSCTGTKKLPIELGIFKQSSSSLKHSNKTSRHSIAITPTPSIQTKSPPHGLSAPVISTKKSVRDKEEHSRKEMSRNMKASHCEQKSLIMETIEEKQESPEADVTPRKPLSETMLREVLIEHGYFSAPKSKHRKRHSEPVLKSNSANQVSHSGTVEEGTKPGLS